MYNAYRVIADNFDRDDFEDFEPPDSLFESDKASLKRNKEEVDESKLQKEEAAQSSAGLRAEIKVFERKNCKVLEKELKEVDKEVEEAETKLAEAKNGKPCSSFLEVVPCSDMSRTPIMSFP